MITVQVGSMRKLEPLKARKAKFGFRFDYVNQSNFIFLGDLMKMLSNWPDDQYITEMVGMSRNDFRVYTDNAKLAEELSSDVWCKQE